MPIAAGRSCKLHSYIHELYVVLYISYIEYVLCLVYIVLLWIIYDYADVFCVFFYVSVCVCVGLYVSVYLYAFI